MSLPPSPRPYGRVMTPWRARGLPKVSAILHISDSALVRDFTKPHNRDDVTASNDGPYGEKYQHFAFLGAIHTGRPVCLPQHGGQQVVHRNGRPVPRSGHWRE